MTSHAPEISFVIRCHNYGRFLGECLASIVSQDRTTDAEIVVVDDASTDSTGKVLADCHHPGLRVIRHSHRLGHVASLNTGLAQARGRYVARIDADDRYRPNFLATLLSVLERYPDTGIAYGNAAHIDLDGRITFDGLAAQRGPRKRCENLFLELLAENVICAPTLIARREVWQRALPVPDEFVIDDWYLNVMMTRHTAAYHVNKVVAEYRVHGGNHHSTTVIDGSSERAINDLLNAIYAEREDDPVAEREKRAGRRTAFATQYTALGDKYFGAGLMRDARRCYLYALRHRWRYLMNYGIPRRFVASFMKPSSYERLKRVLRGPRTTAGQ